MRPKEVARDLPSLYSAHCSLSSGRVELQSCPGSVSDKLSLLVFVEASVATEISARCICWFPVSWCSDPSPKSWVTIRR